MDETRRGAEASKGTRFVVPGKPRGKGRPRFARMGNYVRTYTPAETAAYENLVALEYQSAGGVLMECPVEVTILASFAPPKSASKKMRDAMLNGQIVPNCKPDIDNIIKAVLDGLNGVAYKDDTQVINVQAARYYGAVAEVEVWVVPNRGGRFLK